MTAATGRADTSTQRERIVSLGAAGSSASASSVRRRGYRGGDPWVTGLGTGERLDDCDCTATKHHACMHTARDMTAPPTVVELYTADAIDKFLTVESIYF